MALYNEEIQGISYKVGSPGKKINVHMTYSLLGYGQIGAVFPNQPKLNMLVDLTRRRHVRNK